MESAISVFNGCELAFKQTYFPETRSIVRINTDAPVSSLASREVPASAGSFAFPRSEHGLHNRFIVWRANGPSLYLDEFSAERDLQGSSLRINYSQSVIIPGTSLHQAGNFLLLVVPTQSGISCFSIPLPDVSRERLSVNQSTLNRFQPTEGGLARFHYFHPFSCVASKAAIGVLSDGAIVAALCTDDKQLIRVVFRSPKDKNEETILEGPSRFGSFLSLVSSWSQVWDVCMSIGEGGAEAHIYSVHQDGKIREWKSNSKPIVYGLDDLLRDSRKFQIVDVCIKAFSFPAQRTVAIVLKFQSASTCRFYVLEVADGRWLGVRSSCKLETKHVIDYMCTPPSALADQFSLWAITRRGHSASVNSSRTLLQPYILKRCSFSMTVISDSIWEDVEFGLGDDCVGLGLVGQEDARKRIFDQDRFSLGVVRRAVEIVCKSDLNQAEMEVLRDFVGKYLNSAKFNEANARLSYEDSTSEEGMGSAREKFWSDLYTSCSQLQEEDAWPVSFVYSDSLHIIGVIQQSRFTVYLPPDDEMCTLVRPNRRMLKSLLEIGSGFPTDGAIDVMKNLDPQKTLAAVGDHIDGFSRLVQTFAEHSPVDAVPNLIENNSEYLASSLSTAFLAMGLRRRVMGRLRFADAINKLLSILPHIGAISTEMRTNARLDLALNSCNSSIAQIMSCYSVMCTILSERLSKTNDSLQTEIAVAQAFFKFGGPNFVKKLPHSSPVASNANTQVEVEDDEVQDDSMEIPPQSRWDRSTFLADPTESPQSEEKDSLQSFVRETVTAALSVLWPKSSSLALPRFLLRDQHYGALAEFCALNESTSLDSAYTLRYFQAIALSGTGKPEDAWMAFNEVAMGVVAKDSVLNSVLSDLHPIPRSLHRHLTLAEFFFEVMRVFSFHRHASFVIHAGEKAVRCTNREDPLLPEIYTILFTQQLVANNPKEALRFLLANPSAGRQSNCLRQLLTHMIDSKQPQVLVNLSYGRLTDTVADILETRCRAESTRCQEPSIHAVAYAFHVMRSDYAKAATVMYHLSQRLKKEVQNKEILERRCQVLATAHQTMQILETEDQQIVLWEAEDTVQTLRVEHVQRELMKAEARYELIDADPEMVPPLDEKGILTESLKHKNYDMAWIIIREFGLPAYEMMELVCADAIIAEQQNAPESTQNLPNWISSNRQFVGDYDGELKPHWKLVVSYVDLALKQSPTDAKLLRSVGQIFQKNSVKIPDWLLLRYKEVNFGDLLLLLVEYEDLKDAFDILLPQIDFAMKEVAGGDNGFLLPDTQIQLLLHYAKKSDDHSLPIDKVQQKLKMFDKLRDYARR